MCLAGAALGDDTQLDDGLVMLEKECAVQVLADGGHANRSPEALAHALLDIQVVDDFLARLGVDAPGFLTRLQPRMSAMLGFFTLPNGSLLPVNGGGEGPNGLATAALQPYGETASRFTFARLSGYQRVQANRLTLYMDAGAGPEKQMGGRAHAGALAIYVADGEETIFTSCGAHEYLEPLMREASRQTAAHSVLGLPGKPSAEFVPDVDSGLRSPSGPPGISARRLEENDQFLLEGQHGGWRARHGLIYRRRLYVERDGTRITGEDSLSRPLSETTAAVSEEIPFEIRFHLHPDAQIIPGDDPQTAFIGLPRQQAVWRFRSEALLSIEDSRYWGVDGTQPTSQLVVRGSAISTGDGSKAPNRVRWALLRVETGV